MRVAAILARQSHRFLARESVKVEQQADKPNTTLKEMLEIISKNIKPNMDPKVSGLAFRVGTFAAIAGLVIGFGGKTTLDSVVEKIKELKQK